MKVVDMHCDTIGAIFEKRNKGIACNLRKNDLQPQYAYAPSEIALQKYRLFSKYAISLRKK